MLRTNIDKTVMQSLQGKIHHPINPSPFRVDVNGNAHILPATGGITYNVKVGDCAFGWSGDHVEPGVSIRNEDRNENNAMMLFACIGNEAKVVTGDAKGAKGFVIGKHGGIEHVLIQFEKDDLEKMAIDDKILIKGFGQGLKLLDYPDIQVMNVDPRLFLNIHIKEDTVLKVPVVAEVPAYLMGSGIGALTAFSGDYDIMTEDLDEIKRLGLDKLKFGDLVLLRDCDNSYGRGYLKGAVSIGVVIHSDCIKMGHGPGITTIMTCKKSLIEGYKDENANILNYIDYIK
ncbi:DUF4438 domain-containing protein [Caloramator sp. E03]|uniref:DUF4438 domain-containing protein n=1 Tax=Caloramator sp. E03 TaxID=2576307 RepID=UPI001110C28A|nr:DUF4438 domain-containing protein [Caloramator sp. E03]QCX33110.1 DUF4438 domain-containing protein [Caloramator sp. E03]